MPWPAPIVPPGVTGSVCSVLVRRWPTRPGSRSLSGPRDYDKVKRDLAAAGYRGEPIVVLTVSDNAYFLSIAQVGADQLRKAGLNVDLQTMDFATMVRRRASKEPPEKGGWNVFFTFTDGLFSDNPATNIQIRGDGKSGLEGWPVSPKLEALRDAWLETGGYRCAEADRRADAATDVARTCRISPWVSGFAPPRTGATSSICPGDLPRSMGCEGSDLDFLPAVRDRRGFDPSYHSRSARRASHHRTGRRSPLSLRVDTGRRWPTRPG